MGFSVIEKRSKVSSPTINVTFSDGYMDTIVLWKPYSNKEQKRNIENDKIVIIWDTSFMKKRLVWQ